MKLKNKIILFALFFVIILSSCTVDTDDNAINTSNDNAESVPSDDVSTSELFVKDSLPENLDFDGADVNFLLRDSIPFNYEMGVESADGEIVNDAIYNRNRIVEERLNVNINTYPIISGNGAEDIVKLVMAGDDTYHVFASSAAHIMKPVLSKAFYNLNDVEYLDFDKPWWVGNLNEAMTIYDMIFSTAGDIALSMIQYEACIFYNQNLYEKYNIRDDIYEIVTEGKWTIDKLTQLSKNVSGDLNGDGIYNKDDLYGFSQADSVLILAMGRGAGFKIMEKNGTGFPQIVMDTPLVYTIIDTINNLFTQESSYVTLHKKDEPSNSETQNVELTQRMFINDQILFFSGHIINMEGFREMESDYGIVPIPKFDENQENYVTNVRDTYSMVTIPVTCPDIDMTGAALEAMASESYRTVTPVYFNIALKDKYSRDERTAEMINIIHQSVAHDFGISVTSYLNYISHTFQHCIENTTNEFGSLYASRIVAAETGLANLKTAYDELRVDYSR